MEYKQSEEQQRRGGSEVENCSAKTMQECAEVNVHPKGKRRLWWNFVVLSGGLEPPQQFIYLNISHQTVLGNPAEICVSHSLSGDIPELSGHSPVPSAPGKALLEQGGWATAGPFQPHPCCGSLQVPTLGFTRLTPFSRNEQLV